MHLDGMPYAVVDTTRDAVRRGGDGRLHARTTGRVVAVRVSVGERVIAGQPLVTLEATKLEHAHAAPLAGTVRALHVGTGDQVAAGRVVAEVEPDAAPG